MAQNPRISRFPARGGPVGQNVKCKKVADNHPGQGGIFFFRFGTPSTGKLRFSVFSPGPEFLQVPQAENRPNTH